MQVIQEVALKHGLVAFITRETIHSMSSATSKCLVRTGIPNYNIVLEYLSCMLMLLLLLFHVGWPYNDQTFLNLWQELRQVMFVQSNSLESR